jgi:hypothetical protein
VEKKNIMNHENGGKPRLLDAIANKWKTASGGKKVMWLAIALLAAYFVYQFKKNWDKIRAEQKNNSTK